MNHQNMEDLCKEIYKIFFTEKGSERNMRETALKHGYTFEEFRDIYNNFLNGNGMYFIPSVWKSSYKNTTRGKFRLSYIDDIQKYEPNNNIYIGNTPRGCIRLMTYNVHFWRDPFDININHDKVVNLIEKYKPDIFGFQEVLIPGDKDDIAYSSDEWSVPSVLTEFGHYHSPKNDDDYNIQYNGVSDLKSSKNTKFGNMVGGRVKSCMFLGTRGLTLPSDKENRCAIICDIFLFQSQIIIIAIVHLDVYDFTGETRRKQMKVVLSDLERYKHSGYPIIIMGDFNCMKEEDYDLDERGWLSRNSNCGVDFETIKLIESSGYKDLFLYPLKCSVWTGRRVDFIFGKNIPEKWSVKSSHVVYDQSSDHLPLIIDMKIY